MEIYEIGQNIQRREKEHTLNQWYASGCDTMGFLGIERLA